MDEGRQSQTWDGPTVWTHLVLLMHSGISSRSQHMALTRIPSSPLPVKAGAPKCSILFIVLFLIFISDLSDSLGNPFYQFLDDSILCRDILHTSNRQVWNVTSWSNTWKITFNPDKCHTHTISLPMDHLANPPILFLKNSPDEVPQSNSWVSQSSVILLRQTTCGRWRLVAGEVEQLQLGE